MSREMVGGCLVKMNAGTDAWTYRMGHPTYTVQSNEKKPARNALARAVRNIHHIPWQHLLVFKKAKHSIL